MRNDHEETKRTGLSVSVAAFAALSLLAALAIAPSASAATIGAGCTPVDDDGDVGIYCGPTGEVEANAGLICGENPEHPIGAECTTVP